MKIRLQRSIASSTKVNSIFTLRYIDIYLYVCVLMSKYKLSFEY